MPNHAHFLVNFWGSYPQNLTLIILTSKGTSLGENAPFESSTLKIHPRVRRGRVSEKKTVKIGQPPKKAQQHNISHMWGEAPANDTATTFGTEVDVQDIITLAKFLGENLKCSDFTGGGRILAFSIDFAYGP